MWTANNDHSPYSAQQRCTNRKNNNLIVYLRSLQPGEPIRRDPSLAQHVLSLARPDVADRSIPGAKIRPQTCAEWHKDCALLRASADKIERLRDEHDEYGATWWQLERLRETILEILFFFMERARKSHCHRVPRFGNVGRRQRGSAYSVGVTVLSGKLRFRFMWRRRQEGQRWVNRIWRWPVERGRPTRTRCSALRERRDARWQPNFTCGHSGMLNEA